MKAMVLAAGFGSRLGELGTQLPKCLVQIEGRTLLERIVSRLKEAGCTGLVVNTHHRAKELTRYIEQAAGFGLPVEISAEEEIQGTGGGIKAARRYLEDQGNFLVHNGDILSALDLRKLWGEHCAAGNLATLAVMDRPGSRRLLFNDSRRLIGWENRDKQQRVLIPGENTPKRSLGFTGVHVLSSEIFSIMDRQSGAFSVVDSWLLAAEQGHPVSEFDAGNAEWCDVGTPDRIRQAEAMVRAGKLG